MATMTTVLPIPAFSDNYIWMLCDAKQQYAAIIDPGDATPVINALEKGNIQPVAILITHHHHDHIGGIRALLQKYPNLVVYGPKAERIAMLTHEVVPNDRIDLQHIGIQFKVLDTSGHTAGHISYYNAQQELLFCGDTLFANGCGRIFDGTVEQLHQSLENIAQLPPATKIYCAHEYTLDNIGFSKWVESDNNDLLQREKICWELLDNDEATIPTLLADELKTNPFLRCHNKNVIAAAERFSGRKLQTSSEVFSVIRHWKDSEYD